MESPIFDTHAHYSARAFDADRFALLDSLPGKGGILLFKQQMSINVCMISYGTKL